jgi:serine/threonine protein kinase
MNVAHRDIKLENILYLSEGDKVKIGDYTVALELPSDDFQIRDNEGTKAFEAPECSIQESYSPKPLDIWAFGITLYSYITSSLPFYANTDSEITNLIVNDEVKFEGTKISDNLKDLICKMLEKDPKQRI